MTCQSIYPLVRISLSTLMLLYAGLLSFTLLHYALAIAAVVLFYIYYTQPDDCTEHKVFISLNLIFCIIISVVSILPKIQVQHEQVQGHARSNA